MGQEAQAQANIKGSWSSYLRTVAFILKRRSCSFADRQVDVKTGTIRVATVFPNPGNLLRPGQYARVNAA